MGHFLVFDDIQGRVILNHKQIVRATLVNREFVRYGMTKDTRAPKDRPWRIVIWMIDGNMHESAQSFQSPEQAETRLMVYLNEGIGLGDGEPTGQWYPHR